MNCGLGNLDSIKRYVLQTAAQADTQFDDVLATIGKGAALALQSFCNRDFARTEDAVDEFSAERTFWATRRYPIESLASLEQKDTYAGAWQPLVLDSAELNLNAKSGIVEFGAKLGPAVSRIRLTYTGGYFFETLEPTDEGYPSTVPEGAAVLPDDLQLAWLVQVNAWFVKRDKLNLINAATTSPEAATAITQMTNRQLEPEVKNILPGFIRYV